MSEAQKDELMIWRNSDEGEAVIADGRAKAKAKRAKMSETKEGRKGMFLSGDSDPNRNQKYQHHVEKAAK